MKEKQIVKYAHPMGIHTKSKKENPWDNLLAPLVFPTPPMYPDLKYVSLDLQP
jgi:hypothetical protein